MRALPTREHNRLGLAISSKYCPTESFQYKMSPLKSAGEAPKLDGSSLRVGIVHARWNSKVIGALLDGARKALRGAGVKDENIVIQSVPGSYELPLAVQKVWAASSVQSSTAGAVSATDLLSNLTTDLQAPGPSSTQEGKLGDASKAPFDAIIALGVLIKGETMHFEYIADAVSHGLMKLQLDHGIPVVFGLLTVLKEEQALARAGLTPDGHNYGGDWGAAAVELGIKRRAWAEGRFV